MIAVSQRDPEFPLLHCQLQLTKWCLQSLFSKPSAFFPAGTNQNCLLCKLSIQCSLQFWDKKRKEKWGRSSRWTFTGCFSKLLPYIWSLNCYITSGQSLNWHIWTPQCLTPWLLRRRDTKSVGIKIDLQSFLPTSPNFSPTPFENHSQVNPCMSAHSSVWPANSLPSENPIPLKARTSSRRSLQ